MQRRQNEPTPSQGESAVAALREQLIQADTLLRKGRRAEARSALNAVIQQAQKLRAEQFARHLSPLLTQGRKLRLQALGCCLLPVVFGGTLWGLWPRLGAPSPNQGAPGQSIARWLAELEYWHMLKLASKESPQDKKPAVGSDPRGGKRTGRSHSDAAGGGRAPDERGGGRRQTTERAPSGGELPGAVLPQAGDPPAAPPPWAGGSQMTGMLAQLSGRPVKRSTEGGAAIERTPGGASASAPGLEGPPPLSAQRSPGSAEGRPAPPVARGASGPARAVSAAAATVRGRDEARREAATRPASFQCSVEPLRCDAALLQVTPGPARLSFLGLLAAYRGVNSTDCDQMAAVLEYARQQGGWRSAERPFVAQFDLGIAGCLARAKRYKLATEYAQRSICVSDEFVHSALAWMEDFADKQHLAGRRKMLSPCLDEYAHYFERRYGGRANAEVPIAIAERYSTAGASAWEALDPMRAKILLERALAALERVSNVAPHNTQYRARTEVYVLENLLEVSAANRDLDTFRHVTQRLNANPNTDESEQVIFDALEASLALRSGQLAAGRTALERSLARYESLPEFVSEWRWEGTRHFLSEEARHTPSLAPIDALLIQLTQIIQDKKTPAKVQEFHALVAGLRGS